MKWFRMHSEARNDAKLRSLSTEQKWVWFSLLCYASEQEERGCIALSDRELLAIECADGDTDLLDATLEKLKKLRIVEVSEQGVCFLNFVKRQYDKASDQPESVSDRVRRHREKSAAQSNADVTPGAANTESITPLKRAVTPCNADVTPEKRLYSDSDSEADSEKKESEKIAPNGASAPPADYAKTVGASLAEMDTRTSQTEGQEAVAIFCEKFKAKTGDPPHIPGQYAKRLKALFVELKRQRYSDAVDGFLSDEWASQEGFSVSLFTQFPADRWRPKPSGKAGMTAKSGASHARQSTYDEPPQETAAAAHRRLAAERNGLAAPSG